MPQSVVTQEPNNSTSANDSIKDFGSLVNESKNAAAVLAESINQENKVFLNFCSELIKNTLQAKHAMEKLETSGSGSKKKNDASKQPAATNSSKASAKATPDLAAFPTPVTDSPGSSKMANAGDPSVGNVENGFAHSMSNMMNNAVMAQQNLFVLGQAATTQTIQAILSNDSPTNSASSSGSDSDSGSSSKGK